MEQHSPDKSSSPLDSLGFSKTSGGQTLDQVMDAQSNVDDLQDSNSFSLRCDEISGGATELFDSGLLLEDERDEDDDELLNCSRWAERWSENPQFNRDSLESHRSLPSDNRPSPSDLTKWSSQRPMDVETRTSVLASQSENNKLATVEKGVGLANLGNTCFLNAVLQCFIHTVPLLHGILSDTHSVSCECSEEGFCVLCALRELVELSLTSTNRVVEPWKLVNNLSYFSTSFQRFQQEDAHEFLQCFLDRLESCHDSKRKDCMYSESGNFVKQVFGGCLISKLKCCNCGHCSDTYEPSIDLSLEIEDADNLLKALQSFTKVEKIEDPENKFTCEKCKEQVPVEKQLAFDQVPSVAAFHLKRFKNDGCFVEKIDKHVAFPLELDLLPFTGSGKPNDAELKYTLYAVMVHIGLSSTSGHYYCFIRLSPDMWCKFDDSRVVQVHEDFVLAQQAYILFYAKEGTPWFSSCIETQKLCTESNILSTSPKSVLDKVGISASSPTLCKNYSWDSNEASDATGLKYGEVEDNENKENELRCNIFETSESKDNLNRLSVSVPQLVSDSFDWSLHESQKGVSPCSLHKVNPSQEVGACGNNQNITPQTPPRSPSPEIYREDPPDMVFSIQPNQVRSVDGISCKRQLNKDLNDLETRQACSFIKKSIPGSRGQQLLAALRGSKSEGSANRKKSRRLGSSPRRDDSNASTYHGSSMRPVLRPLLTGGFR